jgi:hypothetical protein
LFITSDDAANKILAFLSPGVIKKTFTPGMDAWIKVLLAGVCPGSGSFDRIDGIRVGLFGWPITTPLYVDFNVMIGDSNVKCFDKQL